MPARKDTRRSACRRRRCTCWPSPPGWGGWRRWWPSVPRPGRPSPGRIARASWARSSTRFSRLALAAVAVLVATGILNSVLDLASVSDLWRTTYGRVLSTKITLLVGGAGLRCLASPGRAPAAGRRQSGRSQPVIPPVIDRRAGGPGHGGGVRLGARGARPGPVAGAAGPGPRQPGAAGGAVHRAAVHRPQLARSQRDPRHLHRRQRARRRGRDGGQRPHWHRPTGP